jgi:hypothetical protein
VQDLIAQARISEVYYHLTNQNPRPSGASKFRARATWRGGDGYSVALNDNENVWYDHAAGAGGGVLDLIMAAQGGTRQEALGWLADFLGVELDSTEFSTDARATWRAREAEVRSLLPVSRLWRGVIESLTEELLDAMKAPLSDPANPTLKGFDAAGVYSTERLLGYLRRLDGASLVDEFKLWVELAPELTTNLILVAGERERARLEALKRWMRAAWGVNVGVIDGILERLEAGEAPEAMAVLEAFGAPSPTAASKPHVESNRSTAIDAVTDRTEGSVAALG